MENFNKKILTDFYDDNRLEVQDLKMYLENINNCFDKDNENFASLCYYVYNVRQLFRNFCFFNKAIDLYTFDSIMSQFGLSKSDTSRICSCYEKFVDAEHKIMDEFKGFSKSKLFELIQIPNEQLQQDIKTSVLRSDMSVSTIRAYVKNYKTLKQLNQKLESGETEQRDNLPQDEEIPSAYDPRKHYDFTYFEKKSKSQLLNIVWDLQKEYERLKKEIKK